MSEKNSNKFALLLIFLIVFIDLIGFGIIIPILPKIAREFGANPFGIGLLVMSYSLMQFFFTPFWGRLSDSLGRRPIILISLAASALGYLIWGTAGSLTWLFAARIIAGVGNANIAVAQAYITDITTPENRAKGMGLIGAAFGLGFTLGPAVGGLFSQLGTQAIGLAAAGFSLCAFLLAFFILKEPVKRSSHGHDRFSLAPDFYIKTLTNPALFWSLAVFFLATFAFANMETTITLLTLDWYKFKTVDISWLFTYIGFVMVIVQGGLIGRLSKKYPEKSLIAIGAVFVVIGLLSIVGLRSVSGLYFAIGILAVGISIISPSNQSLLSKLANPQQVGGVLGVGQSLSTLGRILGPVIGGLAYQYSGVPMPYFIGACVMFVVFLVTFLLPTNKDLPKEEIDTASTNTTKLPV